MKEVEEEGSKFNSPSKVGDLEGSDC